MTSATGANKIKGFTLVEVMLSVAILGIGLALIANSYLMALRGITSTQNNIQAQFLAKAKFEELEEKALLQNGVLPFSESGVLKGPTRDYDYALEIGGISDSGSPVESLAQACIQLSWQEQNATKKIVFSSYLPLYKEEPEGV
ncbi:MAG: prepilin-type N-terminal cleavage/methylation domain-containing protein [Candidatus Omnitrophota bacterium]